MTQPKVKEDIEARVMDTGDTMTGELIISTSGMYGIRKNRTISGVNYQSCFGTINDNGPSAGIDLYNLDTNTTLSRIFIRPSDIIYISSDGSRNTLLHSGNYTDYTLSKNNSIHMLSDINISANLGNYSSIFRTTTTNCDGVAPSTYSVVCRFRSGYNGSYDLWLSADVNSDFYMAKTTDSVLASSTTWKKIAIFDTNNALSTNKYTNQSTVPIGGIKIHDIRSATVIPGAFGSYVANFYFDEEANGSWKSILDLTGWTAGSYASHQLAFNASTNTTSNSYTSLYHRTGISGTWQNWRTILDDVNYSSILNGTYLPLSGGTLTGQLKVYPIGGMYINPVANPLVNAIYYDASSASSSTYWSMVGLKFANSTYSLGGERQTDMFGIFRYANSRTENGYDAGFYASNNNNFYCTTKLYGAVWNDYAEYRTQEEEIKPGLCAISQRNGKLLLTTERLSPCDGVVSDTFGFAIGETDECQTPLAVSGRVLVYVYGDREEYDIGDCLCAGPGGLAYKMTRKEIKEYPDRIIGIVSEIPEYKEWGTGNVSVNNRIWIKVR